MAGTPATCTEDGVKDSCVCETCGKQFDVYGNEISAEDLLLPSYGHLYDAVSRYVDDTNHSVECLRCGETVTEEHVKPAQGEGFLVVAKAPNKTWYYAGQTLDTDRMEVYTSTVCKDGCKCSASVDPSALTITYANGNAFAAGDTYVDLSYENGDVIYRGRLEGLTVAQSEADIITVDNESESCTLKDNSSVQALGNRKTDTGGTGQSGYGGSYVGNIAPSDVVTFTFTVSEAQTGRVVLRASSNRVVKGKGSEGFPEYARGLAVNDIMKITLNGKEVQVPSNAILGGSISNLEASSNRWTWTNWFDVDLGEQQLINGENTVTVTFLDAGYRDTYDNSACGQLDCMNVFLGGGAA